MLSSAKPSSTISIYPGSSLDLQTRPELHFGHINSPRRVSVRYDRIFGVEGCTIYRWNRLDEQNVNLRFNRVENEVIKIPPLQKKNLRNTTHNTTDARARVEFFCYRIFIVLHLWNTKKQWSLNIKWNLIWKILVFMYGKLTVFV